MKEPKQSLDPYRKSEGSRAAIVFVHGFSGDIDDTWQRFPEFLAGEARLAGWDIWLLGYATSLSIDIAGIWAADPGLDKLSVRLATDVCEGRLAGYGSVAFIAHSMGGLVTQRALADSLRLANRTSHVLLYGTPSAGLKKATLGWLFKPQSRDMTAGGEFITRLRTDWGRRFGSPLRDDAPFRLMAMAGERDEFVPASSSLGPFQVDGRREGAAVVPGNHIEMVKPGGADASCVQLAIRALCGDASAQGPVDAASVAVELSEFRSAIDRLLPNAAHLDKSALVQLAIALDRVGRRQEAIDVLRQHGRLESDTDAMGTLAGRLKRRWLADRIEADFIDALDLYLRALDKARRAGDFAQSYYLGINVAFLQFAHARELPEARQTATQVLADCASAAQAGGETVEQQRWRLATEGEAKLLLGHPEEAVVSYRQALASGEPPAWQRVSMHQQASILALLLGDRPLQERIDGVFRSPAAPVARNPSTPEA